MDVYNSWTFVLNLKKRPSFKVECLFGYDGAQTVIHPSEIPKDGFIFPPEKSPEKRCAKANCYKKGISYVPSKAQIMALVSLSTECTQKVIHTCNFIMLTGFSSWIDANGNSNTYWHGDRNSGKVSIV